MSETMGVCAIVPSGQIGFRPRVLGMGILTGRREVVTAAHVIDAALGPQWRQRGIEPKVRVCFPFVVGFPCIDGTVDPHRWFASDGTEKESPTDIAVILLAQESPSDAGLAVLKEHATGADVTAFGFRGKEIDGEWKSHPSGEHAVGKVIGCLPGGRAQFDGLRVTGAAVEKGFSGAGVYETGRDCVVGMVVESDKDKDRKIAQFIDVLSLKKALGRSDVETAPGFLAASARRAVSLHGLKEIQEKKEQIEEYLRQIGRLIRMDDPDAGLLPYLRPILEGDDRDADSRRAAYGFPRDMNTSRKLYALVSSDEPSVQPLRAILAQRINQLIWRFGFTLDAIPGDWPRQAKMDSLAVQSICEPTLFVRQPTLLDLSGPAPFDEHLLAVSEPSPDATLYAVLRAIDYSKHNQLPVEENAKAEYSRRAIQFLHDYLADLVAGRRQLEDSSNAWWAVRTGLEQEDGRFLGLLCGVAERYNDVRIAPQQVSRLAAVPEIFRPIRTIAYTLSNVQAILELDRGFDDGLRDRLHQVIQAMAERLRAAPSSRHLYLASVHHEGLRNYLDYVKDQHVPLRW